MAHTFTSLLNDGVYSEADDVIYSQPPPSSQECSQQAPSKQKKGRSNNFLIEEDMLLLSGRLNVSMDPVQGNNQTQSTYWNRIWGYYHEHKNFESDRTPTSLCNRWSTINTSVSKFIGLYNQISGKNQSGVTEQDKKNTLAQLGSKNVIVEAHSLKLSTIRESSYFGKKSKTTVKDNDPSSPLIDSPLSTSHGVETESGLERPIGRKAAKKMKKAAFNMSLQLQKEMMEMQKEEQERQKEIMQLQKKKLQFRLAKEERERQKERERQVYEASIIAMGTNTMTSDQAKYYDALKARILSNIV
ncbi:hypothetical protein AgCh_026473 [Apium graveolens]